jgi:hypothetical protein
MRSTAKDAKKGACKKIHRHPIEHWPKMAVALNTGDQGDQGDRGDKGDAPAKSKDEFP